MKLLKILSTLLFIFLVGKGVADPKNNNKFYRDSAVATNLQASIAEKEAIANAINKYLDIAGIKITDLNVADNSDGGKTATGKVSFFGFDNIELKADLTSNQKVKSINTTFPAAASISPEKLVKFMSGRSLSSFLPRSFPLSTGISIKDLSVEFDDKGDSLSKVSLNFGIGSYTIDGFDGFAINNVAIGFILDKPTAPDHKATATVSGDGKIGAVPINLSANMSSDPDEMLFSFTATGINISSLLDGFLSKSRADNLLKFIPDFFKSKQIDNLTASFNPTKKNFTGLAQTSFGEAELQFNGASEESKSTMLFGIAPPAGFKFSNIAGILAPMDGIGLSGTALLISTMDVKEAKSSLDALKDAGDLEIKEGVNIFSTVQLSEDMGKFFHTPSIKLIGAINETFTDMSLKATLHLGLKLGENVTMQDINFGIQLGTKNPVEFTIAGLMEAKIGEDSLGFNASFAFSPFEQKISGEFYMVALRKMNSTKVTGALGTDGKSDLPEWTNPLGIPGVGLQKLGVSAGIDFKFVPIYLSSLGFTGAARFGLVNDRSKHVYGDVTVVIDVTDPTKTLVDIRVKNLTPLKIIEAYRENAGINEPFRTMLSTGFDSAHVLVVPVDGMVAFGKTYNKGIAFGGVVSLGTIKGYADFNLNDGGVSGAGAMDPVDWGNGTFKLSGRTTDKPQFNFSFLKDFPPNLFIDGKISLLGITSETTVLVDDKGFDFTTAGKVADLFEATLEAKGTSLTQSGSGLYGRASMRNDLISKLNDLVTKKIDAAVTSTKATLQGTRDKLVKAQQDLKEVDDRIATKRAQVTSRRNADLQRMRDEASRSMKEKLDVINWHKANNTTSNSRIAVLGNWPWELAEKATLYSAIGLNDAAIEAEQIAYSGYEKTVNALADIGKDFPVEPELADLYAEKGAKAAALTVAIAGVDVAQGVSVAVLETTKFLMDKALGGVFDIKSAEFEGTFGLNNEYNVNIAFNITLANKPYHFATKINFKDLEQSAQQIVSSVLGGNLLQAGFSKTFAEELKMPVTNYVFTSEAKNMNTLVLDSKKAKPMYKFLVTLETAPDKDAGSNEKFSVILTGTNGSTGRLALTKDLYSLPAGAKTIFLVETEIPVGAVSKAQILPLNPDMTDNLKISSMNVQSMSDGKNLHADCAGTVISNGQSTKTIGFDGRKYMDYWVTISTNNAQNSGSNAGVSIRFTSSTGTSEAVDISRQISAANFSTGAVATVPVSIPDIGTIEKLTILGGSFFDNWNIGGVIIKDNSGNIKAGYCNCTMTGGSVTFTLLPPDRFTDYRIRIKTSNRAITAVDNSGTYSNEYLTIIGDKGQTQRINLRNVLTTTPGVFGIQNLLYAGTTNYGYITAENIGEVKAIKMDHENLTLIEDAWEIEWMEIESYNNGNTNVERLRNILLDKSTSGRMIPIFPDMQTSSRNPVVKTPEATNGVAQPTAVQPVGVARGEIANSTVSIVNLWKNTERINEEKGVLVSSVVAEGAPGAQWVLKPVPGTNYFWIENSNNPGHRINVETGTLASSAIQDGAWSAQWILKKNSNGTYWIESRWKTGERLNVEKGKLECSIIQDGAFSAMWNLK